MNWIDGILIVLLLASVIVGSKKGLIRELMAFIVFFTAIIVSVNYIDDFAVLVYSKLGGSPLISALLSFVILIAVSYAVFKILGLLFYKVANIKQVGRRDQMGGALIGFLRGWVTVGFLTLLVFLIPMPNNFYVAFESSFFGPAVAKTIPLMFDGTSKLHPQTPDFMSQMEKTLMVEPSDGIGSADDDRTDVYRTLYRMEKYFTINLDGS